jgi:hypothetical protein
VLSVRLTPAERAAIEKVASAAGQSASDWARKTLLENVNRPGDPTRT